MALALSSPSLSLLSATPTIIKPKVCANINGRLIYAFSSCKLNGHGTEGYNAKHQIKGLAITSIVRPRGVIRSLVGRASSAATSPQQTENSAENLLGTLLSMVEGTDRGAMLSNDEHERVARIVSELEQLCMPEPLKSPFILGEWDVEYCSNPRSPGGYYRSTIGRLLLRTKEMTQGIRAPDFVDNRVAFSAFNAIDGEVSLKECLLHNVCSASNLSTIFCAANQHVFNVEEVELNLTSFLVSNVMTHGPDSDDSSKRTPFSSRKAWVTFEDSKFDRDSYPLDIGSQSYYFVID